MRRLLRLVAVAVPLWALLPAGAVSAHAQLDSSEPAPSSILEAAPERVVLDFNEPVQTQARSIDIYAADGTRVMIGEALVSDDDPTVIYAEGVPPIPDGVYAVAYRVVSGDGHVVEGAYTFQVGTVVESVDSAALVANALAGRSGPGGLEWVMAVARWLGFLGVTVLLGALALVAGGGISSRGVVRLLVVAWSAAITGTVSLFGLQGVYTRAGTYADLFKPSVWGDTFDDRPGAALVTRMVLLVAMAGYLFALRGRAMRMTTAWWRSSVALVGVGVVLTFAASGHPSSSSPAGMAVAFDAVHLAAVSLWLGGLAAIAVGRVTSSPQAESVVARFSRIATVGIPLVVLTGLWQAWHLVDDLGDITETEWGRGLLVKTSIVVVALSLAGLGRWLLRRGPVADIGRLIAVEAVMAVAVLAVTAVMVAKPPEASATPNVYRESLAEAGYIVDVIVSPGLVGNNEVHVTVAPPGGTLDRVESVDVRITLPDSELPTVDVLMGEVGVNHFSGTVAILYPGSWQLEIVLTPDPSSSVLLSGEIDIE